MKNKVLLNFRIIHSLEKILLKIHQIQALFQQQINYAFQCLFLTIIIINFNIIFLLYFQIKHVSILKQYHQNLQFIIIELIINFSDSYK